MRPYLLFLNLIFLFGCDSHQSDNIRSTVLNSSAHEVKDNIHSSTQTGNKSFKIEFSNMILSASSDEEGLITILDYPAQWVGKTYLTHFNGQSSIAPPFSEKHCDMIKGAAESGFGKEVVRDGYQSILVFDIAAFLSPLFIREVKKAARHAGVDAAELRIKNDLDYNNAKISLDLENQAISRIIGQIPMLERQLDHSKTSPYKENFQKVLTVTSGDIICDLISGAAKMTLTYPIKGEEQSIRVLYDPLEIKLGKSR